LTGILKLFVSAFFAKEKLLYIDEVPLKAFFLGQDKQISVMEFGKPKQAFSVAFSNSSG
jgi:hypothetical protein